MNDLISRQAAIDALMHTQEVYSNNFGNDPIDKYTIALIANDIETIVKLPSAQPEQRWILCNERLPDKKMDVIVTVNVGNWMIYNYGRMDGNGLLDTWS